MIIGRRVLTTDEPYITYDNIIPILQKVLLEHELNATRIDFLDNYEKGYQPIERVKTYRPDINVQTNDNVANEITNFKTSFHWGSPITFVQKGNGSNDNKELTDAIAMLNACYESEDVRKKTQHLARNVEIGCRGYTYIDINTDRQEIEEGGSYFKFESLEPRNACVIYSSYYFDQRPMIGVIINRKKHHITAFSKHYRFELDNMVHTERSGERNPLEAIPIIEWIRSYDNMGCFERQIPEMDALNLMISDLGNDVDQNTQAIWHGNDIDFPKKLITKDDGTVEEVEARPKTNDWIITQTTPNGTTPFVKPLAVSYDYTGILSNIKSKRAWILERCNVPQRNDSSGGSTGIAMDSATGWSAAETEAQKQQNIMECCKMEEVKVVLRAIKLCPYVPSDSPLLKLKSSDLQPSIKRSKTYELTVKTNAVCALLAKGFDLQDAISIAPMFEDNNQVIERSGEGVRRYQESNVFMVADNATADTEKVFADYSDQESNSPLIGGTGKGR